MLGNLSYENGMILATSESPCCLKPSIKFLLNRIYGLDDVGEEFQDGCLVLGNLWYANGMLLATSGSPCCMTPPIRLLLKSKYGLEDDDV